MVIGGCGSCPTRLFKGRLGRGRRRPNKRIKDAKQAGERAPNMVYNIKKQCFTVLCNRALLFSARIAPFSVSSLPSRPPISNV